MPSANTDDIFTKPYQPIDTDLVDDIQHYSSDHIHVTIHFKDRDGSKKEIRGFIADVYTTESHEEFLKMEDGRTLRLDQLLEVIPKNGERNREQASLQERLDIPGSRFFPS